MRVLADLIVLREDGGAFTLTGWGLFLVLLMVFAR